MWTNTVGGDHERFGWNLAWRINYTETEDGRDASGTPTFQSPTDPTLRPTVEYDFTDVSNNIVKLYRTVVTNNVRSRGAETRNIDDFPLDFVDITSTKGGDYTSAWTAKFDGSRDFNAFGGELTAKFGALYTTRSKKSREVQFRATAANVAAAGRAPITYSSLAIDDPYEGSTPIGFNFRYYGLDRTQSLMNSLVDAGIAQRLDSSGAFYEVTEDIIAGYAMGTLKRDWGSVVFGARIEQTDNTGAAFASLGLITVSKQDTQVYPSLHINWDFRPDMKLRLGLTTGASRPDFDELAPNFAINDANRTISGGNPEAGPERAVGVDAYFEYYIQPQGYLMAGVFYKSISDALFQQSGIFGLTQFDEPNRPRSEYAFTTFRNGGDGNISGIEFGYNQFAEQMVERLGGPDWAEGFGIRLTATFSQSEINIPAIGTAPARVAGLPGASDTVYNASLVYEKYGLSARLAYQYRSSFLQSVGGYATVNNVLVPDGNGDVFWNDTEQLDFSARFEVSERIELTFDAVNLLDSPGRRYADSKLFPIEYETFGARYLAGVRFKF
jgi:TonB-dependent receptor